MPKPKDDPKSQHNPNTPNTEPIRLAILRALVTGSHSVTQLAKVCNEELVNVSHHLGILRSVGLVTFEREGRFSYYALADAKATATILELTHESGIKVSIPLG